MGGVQYCKIGEPEKSQLQFFTVGGGVYLPLRGDVKGNWPSHVVK